MRLKKALSNTMERGKEEHSTEPTSNFVSVWRDAEGDCKNIFKSLNGYLFILSAFGWFCRRCTQTNKSQNSVSEKANKPQRNICHLVVCICVIFLLLFNCTRLIVAIFTEDSETRSFRILFAGWTVLCFMNAAVTFSWSYKEDGIGAIFKQWARNLHPAFQNIGIHVKKIKLQKISRIFLVISTTIVVLNIVSLGVLIFADIGQNGVLFATVITGPFKLTLTSKIFFLVLHSIDSVAWVFPLLFFVLLCHYLKEEIALYNNNIKCIIRRKSGKIQEDLLSLRMGLLELCKTVDAMDKCFRFAMFVWMCTNIGSGCFCAYILAKTDLDAFGLSVTVFWLLATLVGLGVVSTYSAIVHEEMHASLCDIYQMDTTAITLDQMAQLNLFLTKLTGSCLGITVMGLVTITKELLLTIAGLYVTYFIILLQF